MDKHHQPARCVRKHFTQNGSLDRHVNAVVTDRHAHGQLAVGGHEAVTPHTVDRAERRVTALGRIQGDSVRRHGQRASGRRNPRRPAMHFPDGAVHDSGHAVMSQAHRTGPRPNGTEHPIGDRQVDITHQPHTASQHCPSDLPRRSNLTSEQLPSTRARLTLLLPASTTQLTVPTQSSTSEATPSASVPTTPAARE